MNENRFANIVLPLAVRGKFTYLIPDALAERVKPGCRVIVQFGNRKLYSGLVEAVHSDKGDYDSLKEIVDVIDDLALISETQLSLWDWVSSYYMCTKGEVMKAALPSGLSLESETRLTLNPGNTIEDGLDEKEYVLIKLIADQKSVALKSLPSYISKKNTLLIVNELINRNILQSGESIQETFKPREEIFLKLSEKFNEATLNELLDKLKKAPRQYAVLATYIGITGYCDGVAPASVQKSVLIKNTDVT